MYLISVALVTASRRRRVSFNCDCGERRRLFDRVKMSHKSMIKTAAFFLVFLGALLVQEAESRRVILIGRKAITRTYYKKPLIPAWATITLVGLVMLVLGGGIYFLLNKLILGDIVRGPKFAKVARSEAEV